MTLGSELFFALFNNLAIFIVLVAIYGISLNKGKHLHSPLYHQIQSGILFGLFAVGSMYARIPVADGVIVDQRNAVIALSGMFGGPITAAIAAIFPAIFRIHLGGAGVLSGVVGVFLAAGSGVLTHYLLNPERSNIRLAAATLLATVGILPGFLIYGPWPRGWELLKEMVLPYGLAIMLGIFLAGILLRREKLRFKAELQIRHDKERFKDFAESASDWFWELDENFRFVFISNKIEAITGHKPESFIGLRLNSPEDFHMVDMEWNGLLERLSKHQLIQDWEFSFHNTTGDYQTFQMNGIPVIDTNGVFVGYRGTTTDITDQKQNEDSLHQALHKSKVANEAKSQFVANMSHEVRTPMNGILGAAQLLAETPLTEEQQDYMKIVRNSCDSLSELVGDVLDLSKLDNDIIEIKETLFDLEQLTVNCLSQVKGKAAEKQLDLAFAYDPTLPRMFKGDPGRLRQCLLNLIGNAVKFTAKGHVIVKVEPAGEWTDGLPLKISVEDTGIGIAKEDFEKIFEEFNQADNSSTRSYGGSGLGLSIVRRLIQLFKGNVYCESEIAVGSRFVTEFTLQQGIASSDNNYPDLKDLKCLLVSENQVQSQSYLLNLKALGLSVIHVPTASALKDQLAAMKSGECPLDLALIDCNFQDGQVFELADQLRNHSALKATQLILLTDTASKHSRQVWRKAGFSGFLDQIHCQSDLAECMLSALPCNALQSVPTRTNSTDEEIKTSALIYDEGLRILVVDDFDFNLDVIRHMLERFNLEVDTANNGKQALFLCSNTDYDLIFLDCKMPIMDGFETVRRIRALEANLDHKRVPIIAYTANALVEDRNQSEEAGMDGLITKPIEKKALVAILNQWLPQSDTLIGPM